MATLNSSTNASHASMNKRKIKVIIVDDSALMCAMIRSALLEDEDFDVLAFAHDPFEAREKIKQLNPDIITLDIQMPKMDGLSFLEKIMALRPMPVVMLSSLTEKGRQETLYALECGALDYHCKPDNSTTLSQWATELRQKLKAAASAKVKFIHTSSTASHHATHASVDQKLQKPVELKIATPGRLLAIGSSTGGVEALNEVIPFLPANSPPVVVVQHMPEKFTASFANRLNGMSHAHVVEAQDSMILKTGTVYIAPGNKQMEVVKSAQGYMTVVRDGDLFSGHKPSVDVLFLSLSKLGTDKISAAILTGMGKDGAIGLKALRDIGAYTVGQNEDTCVVYGMPKAAKQLGAVKKEVPINQIATSLLNNEV